MKNLMSAVAVLGLVAASQAMALTPASAVVVSKTVTAHHGPLGHGCRTVRTVARGPMGKRVSVRRVCR